MFDEISEEDKIISECVELEEITKELDNVLTRDLQQRKEFIKNISKECKNALTHFLYKKVKLGEVTLLERDFLHILMEDYIITKFN